MSNKYRGYTPRVIFYSQTSKGHEYNYGNPVITLTGRNSRHIVPSISTERKLLDYIKPHPQPNSNRTIIPDFENLESKCNNKKSKINYGSLDNTFCDISNRKQRPSIKTFRKKNKTYSELLNDLKEEKKALNDNLNKNSFSFYIKNENDYNSKILNLPGANKRKMNDKEEYGNKHSNKTNMNSTANYFRQRNINSNIIESLIDNNKQNYNKPYSVSHIIKKSKNNNYNDKLNDYSNLIYSSNSIFYKNNNTDLDKNNYKIINNNDKNNNYQLNYLYNDMGNKENYLNNYQNNNDNFKTKNPIKRNNYSKIKKNKSSKKDFINEAPFKKQTNSNSKQTFDFFQPINDNKNYKTYYNNVYKEKKNSLITHYSKRKNINSSNKLFNEIHQQDNNYSLLNYYGENYSKKNYSQIQLY